MPSGGSAKGVNKRWLMSKQGRRESSEREHLGLMHTFNGGMSCNYFMWVRIHPQALHFILEHCTCYSHVCHTITVIMSLPSLFVVSDNLFFGIKYSSTSPAAGRLLSLYQYSLIISIDVWGCLKITALITSDRAVNSLLMRLSQHPICAQGKESLRAGSNPGIVDTIRVKGLITCHCRGRNSGRSVFSWPPAQLSSALPDTHIIQEKPHNNALKGHSGEVDLL